MERHCHGAEGRLNQEAPPIATSRLDLARAVCLALPEATEQVAWGEPTFRVRKKMFAMFAGAQNHHGAGRDALWVNAPLGVQEHLVADQPDVYFVPPYVGVKGWVGIDLIRVGRVELRAHVLDSYCMVAPKKLLALLPMDTSGLQL